MTSSRTDLPALLAAMDPEVSEDEYVFCCLPEDRAALYVAGALGSFREPEGTTLILLRRQAENAGLPFTFPCRRITLLVSSGLEAVGFLALVTSTLAAVGIPVNAVSGYHHDHLLVPTERAAEALVVLENLAATGAARLRPVC